MDMLRVKGEKYMKVRGHLPVVIKSLRGFYPEES